MEDEERAVKRETPIKDNQNDDRINDSNSQARKKVKKNKKKLLNENPFDDLKLNN